MNAHDVLETLHPLLMNNGKPEFIRSDNGPEFIATYLQDWLERIGIKPMQIYPGSPWEMGITSALTAPCEKKSSTQNGSTPHGKPRSLSMFGSGNTTRSDLTMP
jgi:hypothetical protein